MKFNIQKDYWGINTEKAEKKYKAKYLGDFTLKDTKGNWSEIPWAVFYVKNPNKKLGHSHYFGLRFDTYFDENKSLKIGSMYITDGKSISEVSLVGVVADDGEICISCYRHDYRESTDKSTFIDGGRDYTRTLVNAKTVEVKIIDGNLTVI